MRAKTCCSLLLGLSLLSTCGPPGEGAEPAGPTATTAAAIVAGRALPPDVETAKGGAWARMDNLAKAWAMKFKTGGQVFPSYKSGKTGLREVEAGLYILLWEDFFDGWVDNQLGGAQPFKDKVLAYFKAELKALAEVGTDDDYDMYLRELLPLMVDFRDRDDLLSNDMIWEIVCQDGGHGGCNDAGLNSTGVATFSGQSLNKQKNLGTVVGSWTETENHVLMIHSWRYFINDWVKWVAGLPADHPRYDQRVKNLYARNPAHYDNEAGSRPLVDFLLQALGRPLHNGMFEENARPYENLSFAAILNVFSSANLLFESDGGAKVKAAARNALDFLVAKFAFQSFEGKRIAPMRRLIDYKDRFGVGNNDYEGDIIGVFTGAYVFEDAWDNLATIVDGTTTYYQSRYAYPALGEPGAYALWAGVALRAGYMPPDNLIDFLINKRQGFYTRAYSNFWRDTYDLNGRRLVPGHYGQDIDATYFVSPTQAYKQGTVSSEPEFYFVTPDYMSSAGGFFRQYYFNTSPSAFLAYNLLAKPFTVLTKGDIGRFCGVSGDDYGKCSREILMMRGKFGGESTSESKNLWTYKNFSYGFAKNGSSDLHTIWPQLLPDDMLAQYDTAPTFSIGRATFKLFDLRSTKNFYVVNARVSKSSSDGQFRQYARGFWEIVPASAAASLDALKTAVKANNPSSFYDDNTSHPYYYKTVTSGDKLQLDQRGGSSVSCRAIMAIWDHTGVAQNINTVFGDPCNDNNLKALPLLEVKEVDARYRFTGRKYAEAAGNGLVIIRNPFYGGTVELDSRDYTAPTRREY